jgi:hypothetical protein
MKKAEVGNDRFWPEPAARLVMNSATAADAKRPLRSAPFSSSRGGPPFPYHFERILSAGEKTEIPLLY